MGVIWYQKTFPKSTAKVLTNLNNYFDFHVCLSFRLRLRRRLRRACVRKLAPISAVRSQNDTNKSCLVSVMSEKYACWVNLRPQWDRCSRGKAKVRILDFKTIWSEFQKPSQTAAMRGEAELHTYNLKKHHLLRVGPKQLCVIAQLGCTPAASTS